MKKSLQIQSALLLFALVATTAGAQNVLDNKIYRVTGYQRGNANIVSVSNYAEVIPPQSIYVPNTFTPNSDGMNDTFGVKGEGIQDFKLLIFNRWGEKIFETENPRDQWDGTYKGQPVQIDSYVYEVYAKSYGNNPRTGSVNVLR